MKTDLCISCSYMLKVDFLSTWSNKKPRGILLLVYNLIPVILFSEVVCCTHTFSSLMLLFNGYVVYGDYKTTSYFPYIFTQTVHLRDL